MERMPAARMADGSESFLSRLSSFGISPPFSTVLEELNSRCADFVGPLVFRLKIPFVIAWSIIDRGVAVAVFAGVDDAGLEFVEPAEKCVGERHAVRAQPHDALPHIEEI